MENLQKCNSPNPIIEIYKGKKIRKYHRIYVRVSQYEAKQFIDLFEKGLSERDVLCHTSKPCNCCQGRDVVVYDREGNEIKIKRGILTNRK